MKKLLILSAFVLFGCQIEQVEILTDEPKVREYVYSVSSSCGVNNIHYLKTIDQTKSKTVSNGIVGTIKTSEKGIDLFVKNNWKPCTTDKFWFECRLYRDGVQVVQQYIIQDMLYQNAYCKHKTE